MRHVSLLLILAVIETMLGDACSADATLLGHRQSIAVQLPAGDNYVVLEIRADAVWAQFRKHANARLVL